MVSIRKTLPSFIIIELDRVAVDRMAQTDAFGPVFELLLTSPATIHHRGLIQHPQRCSKPNAIKAAQNGRDVLAKFAIETLWNAVRSWCGWFCILRFYQTQGAPFTNVFGCGSAALCTSARCLLNRPASPTEYQRRTNPVPQRSDSRAVQECA